MNIQPVHDLISEVENTGKVVKRVNIRVVSRRTFLKLTGIAGGGLILGFAPDKGNIIHANTETDFVPNGFMRITTDGKIILYAKNPEVGQGVKTALPMILAEELDVDWSDVQIQQSTINENLYGPQFAGGSRSVPSSWDQLRRAGAVARNMLVQAAAHTWKVPISECRTEAGRVIHPGSGRDVGYGRLAAKAATMPAPDPDTVPLKDRSEYKLLGKRITGVDNLAIVTGAALFGTDTVIPDMLYAAYEKCPATGGRVINANLDEIRQLPGIRDAFVLEGNDIVTELMPGVAVVADSTWAAISAKKQLKITWDEAGAAKDSWTGAVARARQLANTPGQEVLAQNGNITDAYHDAAAVINAYYTYPFVSHAPLEPQNCTAWVHDGIVELWAPTQTPQKGVENVANTLGISKEKVVVHQMRGGGGFGRRLMNDYMCEAAAISARAGTPIKLQWTREDDMRHDFYRVGGFHALQGAVDKNGKLTAWEDHFITFADETGKPVPGGNFNVNEFPVPMLGNSLIRQSKIPLQIPCGPWRAPRSNSIAFITQCFLHELAVAAGRDHLDFLLEVMGEPRWLEPGNPYSLHTGRATAVIKLAAEKAGWGKSLPLGRGLGLAFHFSHAGHFAEVAEVSVDSNRKLTIHRVTVAGDVGPVINLSGAENQCQGAVLDGISTMLGLSLSFENGRIQESNFDNYPLLQIKHTPEIPVYFIESEYPPTGLGEPALPPAAPAVCNAIFAASGHRVRELPLSRSGFTV